jgi:succinyl-diaminopimelate desuccinylase
LGDARDLQDVTALAQRLIRIPSPNPPGEERLVAEEIVSFLGNAGIAAQVIGVGGDTAPQANVFARVPGTGGRPALVFSGHMDTVPAGKGAWERDPYAAAVEGGRLWGLGASDMKAAVAAMCIAAVRVAQEAREAPLRGDLLLAFTSNEETSSRGARQLAGSGLLEGAAGLVIGEPTANRLGIAEKGGIWLDVALHGRTAHGSLPHLGANALTGMAELLTLLEGALAEMPVALTEPQRAVREAIVRPAHPLLGAPTCTPTLLSSGVAMNVVPDGAVATLDIRTLPGQSGGAIHKAVESLAQEVAGRRGLRVEISNRGERVALETAESAELVLACSAAIEAATGQVPERIGLTGATDATELVPPLGLPFIICGPGEMAQAHQPNESVAVDALEESVEIYVRLAQALLA